MRHRGIENQAGMAEMFRYMMGIIDKEEKKTCGILVFLSFVSPLLDLFCYSSLIYVINFVLRTDQVSTGVISFNFFMVGISLLKIFLDLYRCRTSTHFLYQGAQKISTKLYEVLMKEDLESHNRKDAVQAIVTVQGDAMNCINIIVTAITICSNVFMLGGFSIVLICVSKWIGLVSCMILSGSMLGFYFFYRNTIKVYGEECRAYRIKANAQTAVAYGAFREIKIDHNVDHIRDRYREISSRYAKVQEKFKYGNSRIGILLQNMILTVLFASLSFFLVQGNDLSLILGLMLSYITAFIRMIPEAYGILSGFNNIEFLRRSYEVVREDFIRYQKIKKQEEMSENCRQKKVTFRQGLRIRDLTFSYNEYTQIFEKVNVDIPAGCSVAVIGVSGAGKTTFLDLVLGLLKPQAGRILYDDYDIVSQTDKEGICMGNLGEIVSYIPQTIYLNGETIRNNVAFFEKQDEIDDGKIEEVLKCAQIWEDVLKLPEGVDTLIGENGTVLSGGQRQRIALARALYKDCELLVMDEATAALDTETEKAVIDSVRRIKENKTILMVTHHMSLANECDIIYKIEDRKMTRVK